MGVALYRKYRSKVLGEVIGQEHITTTLKKAIGSGRISHAYLFTGPRGVGKTSVARILAHEVNGLQYKDDAIHLDIIEIDAASNRRIDEIRDLRDKVHISPTSARYKVYIIDEVHMLTREAFNALLKTLEEPPAHCIFILATTEAHKLPDTIISRTQRFSFKPITPSAIASHLRFIAGKENFKADDDALQLLAEHADGSFRDAISMLDQIGSSGKAITHSSVLQLLGTPPAQLLVELWTSLQNSNSQEILKTTTNLKDQGYNAPIVASELSGLIRNKLLAGTVDDQKLKLLRELLEVPTSPQPQQQLEIALLGYVAYSITTQQPKVVSEQKSVQPKKEAIYQSKQVEPKIVAQAKSMDETSTTPIKDGERSTMKSGEIFSLEQWPNALAAVKDKAASLYTALRLAEPRFETGVLTLAFQFQLHQKKFTQPANEHLLIGILNSLGDGIKSVDFIVDPNYKPKLPPVETIAEPSMLELNNEAESSSTIDTINNIFGGAEVLES